MTARSLFRRLFKISLAIAFVATVALASLFVFQPRSFGLPAVMRLVRARFPEVRQVSPQELADRLADKAWETPQLLDVRTEPEFAVSHLPGARRVDPDAPVDSVLDSLDRNRPVVVYCSVGYRSSALGQRMIAAGFTNVANLEGSIFGWANEGRPLEQNGTAVTRVHPYNESAARMLKRDLRAAVPPVEVGAMTGLFHELWQTKLIVSLTVLFLLAAWETVSPFVLQFRERPRERLIHAARNLTLGAINGLMIAALFVGLWFWAARWAEAEEFGLLNWLRLPLGLHLAGAFVLFDAWMYLWHRLNHRVPFLWRFHRAHHSDPQLDVTTANRFHLGEIFLSSCLRVPVILLVGMHLWELVCYEILMFSVVQLHHANCALPSAMDRILRLVIVTPLVHKVHHSCWRPETDSNYGSLFAFWDRLFGSFRLREDPGTIQFGLEDTQRPAQQTLGGLLTMPLTRPRG